ncbi:hypothetical protein KKC59_04440, partial [bacterium]|nr:hypothetical protein [bacterium]
TENMETLAKVLGDCVKLDKIFLKNKEMLLFALIKESYRAKYKQRSDLEFQLMMLVYLKYLQVKKYDEPIKTYNEIDLDFAKMLEDEMFGCVLLDRFQGHSFKQAMKKIMQLSSVVMQEENKPWQDLEQEVLNIVIDENKQDKTSLDLLAEIAFINNNVADKA